MSATTPPAPGILATIAAAFRQNRVPCLLLNALVIALVTSYYRWPAMAGMWEAVGAFKLRWSYGFSLASTVFVTTCTDVGGFLSFLGLATLLVRYLK